MPDVSPSGGAGAPEPADVVPETIATYMRLRGLECCAPENLAEAFYARKLRIADTVAG